MNLFTTSETIETESYFKKNLELFSPKIKGIQLSILAEPNVSSDAKPEIYHHYLYTERGIAGHTYYYINDAFNDQAYTFRNDNTLSRYSPIEEDEVKVAHFESISSMLLQRKMQRVKFDQMHSEGMYFRLISPWSFGFDFGLKRWRNYELEVYCKPTSSNDSNKFSPSSSTTNSTKNNSKDKTHSQSNTSLSQLFYTKHIVISPIGDESNLVGWNLIEKDKALSTLTKIGYFQKDYSLLRPGALFLYYNYTDPFIVAIIMALAYVNRKLDLVIKKSNSSSSEKIF